MARTFLPTISDFSRINKAYAISDRDSFLTGPGIAGQGRDIGRLFNRNTVSWLPHYDIAVSRQKPRRVLTFACDTGNRYLSKMFNDFWMRDQGFIESPTVTVTSET